MRGSVDMAVEVDVHVDAWIPRHTKLTLVVVDQDLQDQCSAVVSGRRLASVENVRSAEDRRGKSK